MNIIKVAHCEVHGLHGQRERCYVCDRPCSQVEMVPVAAILAAEDGFTEALEDAQHDPDSAWLRWSNGRLDIDYGAVAFIVRNHLTGAAS